MTQQSKIRGAQLGGTHLKPREAQTPGYDDTGDNPTAVQCGCTVLSMLGVLSSFKVVLFNGISILSRKQCPGWFELICIVLTLVELSDHFDFPMRRLRGLCSPARS